MAYSLKSERRKRARLMRKLAWAQFWAVRELASSYVYGGNTYSHCVDDLRSIHNRIASVYMKGENDV